MQVKVGKDKYLIRPSGVSVPIPDPALLSDPTTVPSRTPEQGTRKPVARNVHFISSLMESGVEFVAVDFPQANRLTVHILAAVAEHEASMISARTKAALGAAKARGVSLGGLRGSLDRMGRMARKGNAASAIVRQAASAKRNEDLFPVIEDIHIAGFSSPQQIADALNERGITAARGGAWSAVQVRRILRNRQ